MDPLHKIIRVLLVDDDEDDYLIIRSLIGKIAGQHFRLQWVSDIDEAGELIKSKEHDVYLVDYRLGAEDGLELLARFDLVQREEPFIILTGAGDERVERRAMKMGVADYLVKGTFDAELLSRVMRYSLQRKRLEAQRIQQLIELNKSKDEFIALASHQLRTPATAVKQYVGMILQGYAGDVPPEQRKFLESAYESNERQIDVVNDILRIAQLDLKKISLTKRPTDLGNMLAEIVRDAEATTAQRSQKVTYRQPKHPVEAYVDPEQIRMVFGNILDNASKYTPEGKGITITVKEVPGGQVSVSIADQGVGIAPEDRDRLFKKFSRIHNVLSVEVGGSGLGLYWAHEVVLLHEGTITVESAVGKGTTFTVLLPRE